MQGAAGDRRAASAVRSDGARIAAGQPGRTTSVAIDALVLCWPAADAIIGNPPYQVQEQDAEEHGPDYVQSVSRRNFPVCPAARITASIGSAAPKMSSCPAVGRGSSAQTQSARTTRARAVWITSSRTAGQSRRRCPPRSGAARRRSTFPSSTGSKASEAGAKKLIFQRGDHRDSPSKVLELPKINSAIVGLRRH